MTALHAVQAHVENAAQAIVTLPPEQWPGWAVYLLEALDMRARERQADPAPILAAVKDDLTTRLDSGRW